MIFTIIPYTPQFVKMDLANKPGETMPTYNIGSSSTALIVVDPQVAFGSVVPVPDVQVALANMRRAVIAWRANGNKVYLTRHSYASPHEVGRVADFLGEGIYDALREGSSLGEFHPDIMAEGDAVLRKTRFNALEDTALMEWFSIDGIKTVVVCGLTTPICVQATVDSLMMRNFEVVVIVDACASQPMGALSAEEAHRASIERMRYIFAEVVSTDEFLNRLAQ